MRIRIREHLGGVHCYSVEYKKWWWLFWHKYGGYYFLTERNARAFIKERFFPKPATPDRIIEYKESGVPKNENPPPVPSKES